MATFQAKAFQKVASSAFNNAKKLADLRIKQSVLNGKATPRGYQEAISILEQYQFSSKESEALDAQRLVQGYENELLQLQNKKRDISRTVSEFKVNEREAFYVTPTTQFRNDTMFDIPEVVADTTEELRQLVFAVGNAIDERTLTGESTGDLENYYFELYERYRKMEELNNDLLNEEIPQAKALNGYGVYVDADQNDGQVYGISVAPMGNLPQGLNQSDYQRLESSVNYGGGHIPVFSRFSTDDFGGVSARIGSRVWTGDGKISARYDRRKSDDRDFNEKPGALNLSDFAPKKVSPIRPGEFFKGFTGYDEEGSPIESLFYASPNEKLYTVDEKAKGILEKDFSDKMKKAVGVDSQFAKGLLQSKDVTPLQFPPMLLPPTPDVPTDVPQSPEQPRQETSFFGDRTNRPNVPDRPAIGASAPDLIEQGKSIFRKVSSFFTGQGAGGNQ